MDTYTKDPSARLDYGVDWQPFLDTTDGDTIASAVWVSPDGITVEDQSVTTNVHKAFISGGTDGEAYRVTSRITTTEGRIQDSSILILIKET